MLGKELPCLGLNVYNWQVEGMMWEIDSIPKPWELPTFNLSCHYLSMWHVGSVSQWTVCLANGCDFTTPARLSKRILGVQSANPFLASLMGRYNLLFFASGGGKFNYQGTKRWLEDNLDHTGE